MKTQIKGLLIAAGAAGAFLVYKNWDKIMEKLQGDKGNKGGGSEGGNDTSSASKPESGKQVEPYAQKVEALQGLLKVAIDGKAGNQTNGTLDFYYDPKRANDQSSHIAVAVKSGFANLKQHGRGVVSPDNVDFYIEQLRTAQTPRQKTWAFGGYQDAASQARAVYGDKLLSAMRQGKRIYAKEPIKTEQRKLSAGTGTLVPVPGAFVNFPKGSIITPGTKIQYNSGGFWIMPVTGYTDRFISVSPFLFDA